MAARSPLNKEHLLFFVALLVAVALRFGNLGGLPLTEFEAQAAFPAHQTSQGAQVALGSQTGYTLLSTFLFFIAPSTEFLARFWPALLGCALVALPYFWRDLLGRKTALVLAFALALDPGFVAISRLASGRMLAVFAFVAALTAWRYRRHALAGVFAALALISAPTIYVGVVGVLIVGWLFFQNRPRFESSALRSALLAGAAVLVLGGTLFLLIPEGLGSIGAVLGAFVDGLQTPGASLVQVLFAFGTYGLPALLFGLIGAVRAWRSSDSLGQTLGLVALFNLALVIIYPGRQTADLLWVLLPLWVLGAGVIASYLHVPDDEPRAAWGEAGLMVLLIFFFLLSLAQVSLNENAPELVGRYWMVAGGIVILAIVATLLIGFGWSARAATTGLIWSLCFLSLLFLISDSSRFQRSSTMVANDLWSPGPAAGETGMVAQTLQDLSYWQSGEPRDLAVDLRVESVALEWLLRNFPAERASLASAQLIITSADAQPAEADSYRGQSFVLQSQPAWDIPPNFVGWVLYRSSPVTRQQAILWANLAVFPDGSAALPAEATQ